MKITVTKVIRELQENYGCLQISDRESLIIRDTLKIIDQKLKTYKGISIK